MPTTKTRRTPMPVADAATREAMRAAARAAIAAAGGPIALAQSLQIKYQSVQEWALRGVPPARVLEVEAATGVSRHRLRPDVFGKRPAKLAA